MSIVQSATAEPGDVIARGRYSVADPTAMPSLGQPELDFASVFTMTRESAWLDGLLRKKGEATRPTHARQREVAESVKTEAAEKRSRPADAEEPDAPSSRTERIEDARQDCAERGDGPAESERESVEESRQDRAERFEEARVSERRESALPEEENARDADESQPSAGQPTGIEAVAVSVAGPVSPQPVTQQPDGLQGVSANPSTSSAGNGAVATQVSAPTPLMTGDGTNQAVIPVESASTTIQSTVGKGAADAGAEQASGGTTAGAKGGDTTKPGSAGNDFQTMLQQVGRERAAAVRQTLAGPAKQLSGETVRLDRPEAIEQIARVVRTHANGRTSSMTLRLDPPELGQLRVDVRMQDQTLVVRFQAQTQAAHDLLQDRISELRHALDQHGIRLDRAEIEIRPPTTPNQHGRPADDQQQHPLPQGGESDSGQATGQYGSGDGSHEPESSGGSGSETWTSGDASVLQGLQGDEVDVMSETGVDLVV